MLISMRQHGVRLANTKKNVGKVSRSTLCAASQGVLCCDVWTSFGSRLSSSGCLMYGCIRVCVYDVYVYCCVQACFSFNRFQRKFLPPVYQPPLNVMGKVDS